MPHSDIVIIGGGAIGLSSAYYLNQKGFDVTILDSNDKDLYNSCSWGSSGMIVDSMGFHEFFIICAVLGIPAIIFSALAYRNRNELGFE